MHPSHLIRCLLLGLLLKPSAWEASSVPFSFAFSFSSSSSSSSSSPRNKGNQKIQPKEANGAPLSKTGRSAIRAAFVDGEITVSSVGWSDLLRACSSNETGGLPSSLEERRGGPGSLARLIDDIVRSMSGIR